ncbi:sugar ABC transporter substrate-binding protein [Jonesiaceae bacterium BS-20]|uniref:Sugar ABC transporter substrate-binding protein n=1 Tax=Jonesiaceae bacterium BS-20 TaxID=3120821 RepID=A0AAU7DT64_9MICO
MKSKVALGFGLAVVMTASLAACSSGPSGNADDTVTLQMVESLTSPERTKVLQELIDDFEAANEGIKVDLISPPTEQADQKIQQMLQAGKGVDVVEVRDLTVGSYSTNGWLYDMKSDFADWDGRAALSQTTIDLIDSEDNMYFMPYGYFGLSIFYRTDLIEQAGFDGPPDTWEDLYSQAKTIQDTLPNQYGFALRGGRSGFMHAIQVIESYLADKVDLQNAYFLADGSTIFAQPEAQEALDLYLEIFQDAAPESAISWGFPEMVEGFSNGSTAFLMQDPEVITALKGSGSITTDQWNTTAVLKGAGGKAFQAQAFSGWGVAESSEYQDEAVKLVQFLTSGEASLTFSQNNNQIPILAAGAESDYYKEGPWESYFNMSADPATYIVGNQPRTSEHWADWSELADADLQQLLLGQTTSEEVLTKWDEFWADKR